MLFDILSLLSLIFVLLCLRRLVGIFPSLLMCITRNKENFNIEASIRLSRDRDLVAACMIMPFCLTAVRFNLYDPDIISGLDEYLKIWTIILVFAIYTLFRLTMTRVFRPYRINSDTFRTAEKSSNTFFVILALTLLAAGGLMSFMNIGEGTIRSAMLWISIVIYSVHLIRKLQIFNSSCSVFVGFLYLCALEIIPTGTLVVSALIF